MMGAGWSCCAEPADPARGRVVGYRWAFCCRHGDWRGAEATERATRISNHNDACKKWITARTGPNLSAVTGENGCSKVHFRYSSFAVMKQDVRFCFHCYDGLLLFTIASGRDSYKLSSLFPCVFLSALMGGIEGQMFSVVLWT
jgi:hypothetical protein